MSTKFIFLSNNPKIEFFILENHETVNVTTCRYQPESEVQYDIQTTEVAVGEKNKVVFTFPYEYNSAYDRYSVTIDTEASVIPYRHNEFSVDVKEFDPNTVLALIDAEIETLRSFNFYKCINLKKVVSNDIENNVGNAFQGCKNLISVDFGSHIVEHTMEKIEYNYSHLFHGCSKLESFTQKIKYSNQDSYLDLNNTLFIGDISSLDFAFFECTSLQNLCIITDINGVNCLSDYTSLRSLVDGCTSLTSLTFPSNFSYLPCIHDSLNMCNRCVNLVSIDGLSDMKLNLISSKNVAHMFDRCLKLEFAPTISVKPSDELRKVDTSGIFNNCRKMNRVRITSDSDNYNNILSVPLMQDEEEVEEEKEVLVVSFTEPTREYTMRNAFDNQKRILFLTNVRGGNIIDTTNMFHNCKDVYVNQNYWELETGYGKYGLSDNYQVKYADIEIHPDKSGIGFSVYIQDFPVDSLELYPTITDVVEENGEYLPVQATKAYYITDNDDFTKPLSAVTRYENNFLYVYPLFKGLDNVKNTSIILEYYDNYDVIPVTDIYLHYNNATLYNNDVYQGLISNWGNISGSFIFNPSNMHIELDVRENKNEALTPYVKLVNINPATLNSAINTSKLELINIESNVNVTSISDVERDMRLITKQFNYDKDSYEGYNSSFLAEIRIHKPSGGYISKYIRLFKPSYSKGEGFTYSTTIFDQGNNLTELRNRKYYFTEYTIDVRDDSDLVSSTFTDENGEVFYRYLPRIYNGDNYSYTDYQQIEIFKTDGSKTDDINTSVSDIERIRVWYTEDTTNVKFTGVRVKDLDYLNIDNFSDDMSYMFCNCSYLQSINIKDWSITPTRTDHMFENCYSLKNIDLTTFDTQNTENMSYMFSGCTGLTDINVTGLDTRKLKDMSYMFSGCTGLSELDLSTLDTATVENMGHIFDGCTVLKDVNISNWKYDFNTINPTDIFANCYIENLIIDNSDFSKSNTPYAYYVSSIPNLKTLSAKNVIFGASCSGFFRDITNNISLDVSGSDVTLLTDMSYLFNGSTGLSELDLSTWNTVNTVNMSHIFGGCTGLTELDLSTWDISNTITMDRTFENTTGLKDVNIANWKYDSNTTLPADMYADCYVENLIIDNSDFARSDISYAYYVSSIPHLKTLSAKNVIFGASCSGFFRDITNVITLELTGSDVTLLTDMSYLFAGSSGLSELDITDWNTVNATNMSHMFDGCTGLGVLDVSQLNVTNVVDISSMFSKCTGLAELDLSTWNTSNIENMNQLFYNTPSLKDVNMSNWKYDSNTTLPVDLFTNSYIENLIIDNSDFSKSATPYAHYVSSIPHLKTLSAKNVIFGATCNQFFRDITNIITLDISGSDVTLLTDMSYLFAGSSGLSELDLSSWDTGNVTDISYMLEGCTGLSIMDLSTWNTSNIENMSNFLAGTTSLKDVNLSNWKYDSNTTIPADIFNGSYVENLIIDNSDFSKSNTPYAYYVSSIPYLKTLSAKNVIFGATCNQFFRDITNFITLDVSGSDVTLLTDMSYLFAGSSGLVKLDLSSWDTSNVTDMSHMFEGCTSLSILNMSGWVFKNVIDISYMFSDCLSLTSLNLSSWDTENIVYMSHVFNNTPKLKDVNLSNWRYDSNTTIPADIFANCYIENLIIDNSDFSKSNTLYAYYVNSIPYLKTLSAKNVIFGATCNQFFRDITNIITLDVTNCDVTLLIDMSYLFAGSSGLSELDLTTWDTGNTVNMNHMLDSCTGLSIMDLSTWNTANVVSMSNIFNNTSSLKDVNISNWKYDSNTTIPADIFNGSYIENLIIDNSDFSKSETPYAYYVKSIPYLKTLSAKNIIFGASCSQFFREITNFITLNATGCDALLLEDMSYLFYGSSGLTRLYLQTWNNVNMEESNVTNMSHMFEDCINLEVLDVSNWNTASLSYRFNDMSYMFKNCVKLENIDVHAWTAVINVTNMSHMFENCIKLTGVDLSVWDTLRALDMSYMFSGCSSITHMDLSTWAGSSETDESHRGTYNVSDMSYMFNDCTSLVEITFPEDVQSFPIGGVICMSHMFANCISLASIDLSSWGHRYNYLGIHPKVEDTSYMFYNCSSLKSIKFLEQDEYTLTYKATNLSHMFDGCVNLEMDLQNTLLETSYAEDLSYIFYNCKLITNSEPENYASEKLWDLRSAKDISYMFSGCSELAKINLRQNPFYTRYLAKMEHVFDGCIKLKDVDMSYWSYKSNTTAPADIFANSYIENLNISNSNFNNDIDNLSYAYFVSSNPCLKYLDATNITFGKNCEKFFANIKGNLDLDALNCNTGSLCDMSYLFAESSGLSSVWWIHTWETTSYITDMSYMFSDCINLTDLDMSNWDTRSVTSFSHMFSGSSIKNVNISNWNYIENTTPAVDIFANSCIEHLEIDNSSFVGSTAPYAYFISTNQNLKYISINNVVFGSSCNQFFRDITGLEDIVMSECTFGEDCDGSYMFSGSTIFTSLDLNSWDEGDGYLTDMAYMFYGCQNLVELKMSLMGKGTSASHMFDGCILLESLSTIEITTNTTKYLLLIGENFEDTSYMFYNCAKLAYIWTYNCIRIKTKNASHMFDGCRSLTAFSDYENYDIYLGYVEDASYMFHNCSSLIAPAIVMIGESATDLQYMFANCTSLKETINDNICVADGANISHMYEGCTNIKWGLDIDGNISDASYMYYNCTSLISVAHSGKIEKLDYMFYNCTALKSALLDDIGNPISTECMFYNCTALITIDLSTWDTSGITNATNMFKNVSPLVIWMYDGSNYIDWTLTEGQTCFDGFFPWNMNPSYYVTYTVNSSSQALNTQNSIGEYAYLPKISYYSNDEKTEVKSVYGFSKIEIEKTDGTLTSDLLTLANTVQRIKLWFPENAIAVKFEGHDTFYPNIKTLEYIYSNSLEDCSRMFYNCKSLTDVCAFNTSNITDMSYMFTECSSLTTLYNFIGGADVSNVTNMRYMFYNCEDLSNFGQIGNWDMTNVTSTRAMFASCSQLYYMNDIKNWNTVSLTDSKYMFYNCTNLRQVYLTDWKTDILTDSSYMFYNCKRLSIIALGHWNTSAIKDCTSMFAGTKKSVDWNYAPDDKYGDSYANWTLSETQSGYSGTFPWNL